MKKRTLLYLQNGKALKVVQNATETDLTTFLNATFQLSRNSVVKRHIQDTIIELQNNYRMTA